MAIINSRIKPLSLQLANQIAAGEVVERPASVVKELLENSIDAQSQQIQIEIERGGSALIRIIDDGNGINKEDLSLAVTRHATSKLQTLSELEKIISLGFRGEALASVSAVSKLSIKSKQADQEQAWMINTGTDTNFTDYSAEPEPVAHSQGTTIDVRDLFFNTPARRKFMRTVKTEFKHIDDIVKRIALSQFDIAFKLTHNKKLLRHLPKAVTEKAISQRISKLFSPDFLSQSLKVEFSSDHFSNMGTLRLWGWVSAPQWHRKQSDWQFFYVNGRYIKDKLVNHALRQAYQTLLPDDTFSAYLLYLEIDPGQVDVNVHPTKHEVRFRESRLIHDFIYSALKQALSNDIAPLESAHIHLAHIDLVNQTESSESNTVQREYVNQYSHHQSENHQPSSHQPLNNTHQKNNHQQNSYQPKIHSSLNQEKISEQLNGLKQLYSVDNNTSENKANVAQAQKIRKTPSFFGYSLSSLIPNYLMSQTLSNEGQNRVFIIHIQRAQQFLLMKLFQASQQTPLLIPETVTLNSSEVDLLLKHKTCLHQWGVEISQLGDETLMVRSLPSLCGIPGCTIDTESLLRKIAHRMNKSNDIENNALENDELLRILLDAISSVALSLSEQATLLQMLSEQVNQNVEGTAYMSQKPVWSVLDEAKIDRLFANK